MPPYVHQDCADRNIAVYDVLVKHIPISDAARMHAGGLGGFIRERRTRLGLTQKDLAVSADVAQSTISDFERGHLSLSNADTRRRIASALGVAHVDLLIAAGELTEAELPSSAVVAEQRATYDPNQSASDRFQASIFSTVRRHEWGEQDTLAVIGFIRYIKGDPVDMPARLDGGGAE